MSRLLGRKVSGKGILGAFVLAGLCASVAGQQMDRPARDVKPVVPPVVSFKHQIQPILDAQCVSCHLTGATSANLNLEEGLAYAALVQRGSQQSKLRLVVPCKPDESYLVHKLEGSQTGVGGQGSQMPLLGPLDKESIEMIRQWIQGGALDN